MGKEGYAGKTSIKEEKLILSFLILKEKWFMKKKCFHLQKKIKNVLLLYIMALYFSQEENKEIALGTSKLNYLDPRISVAW